MCRTSSFCHRQHVSGARAAHNCSTNNSTPQLTIDIHFIRHASLTFFNGHLLHSCMEISRQQSCAMTRLYRIAIFNFCQVDQVKPMCKTRYAQIGILGGYLETRCSVRLEQIPLQFCVIPERALS